MALIDTIKTALRIPHTSLNMELQNNINVCKTVCVDRGWHASRAVEGNYRFDKAAELYCKWQEDFQGKGTTYATMFNDYVDAMAQCSECNTEALPNV